MKPGFSIGSVSRMVVCVSALLTAPAIFGAANERPQVQARLVDHAELLCDNCFFGPSYYYYCFETNDKILVGYQKTRVMNWEDKSRNYLTKVHKAWRVWTPPTESVPISFDDTHIWVSGPNGKPLKLTQSYSRDVFITNERCRQAVRSKVP